MRLLWFSQIFRSIVPSHKKAEMRADSVFDTYCACHICELWILNIVVVSRMYASVMALYALRYCVKRRKWQWTRYRAQPKLWVKWTLQQTHNLNIVLINLRFSISFVHKFTTSTACTTWSYQNEWIQNLLSACCRIGIGK